MAGRKRQETWRQRYSGKDGLEEEKKKGDSNAEKIKGSRETSFFPACLVQINSRGWQHNLGATGTAKCVWVYERGWIIQRQAGTRCVNIKSTQRCSITHAYTLSLPWCSQGLAPPLSPTDRWDRKCVTGSNWDGGGHLDTTEPTVTSINPKGKGREVCFFGFFVAETINCC